MRIKKYWCLLISLVLAVSMLGGCKDKSDVDAAVMRIKEEESIQMFYNS